jgi:iron complex outermembrane receptor protein
MGFQLQDLTDFLIWQDADSGAYIQNPDAITPMQGNRINLDPYITYYDNHGGKHSLNTRYYHVANQFEEDADKNNNSDIYFGEYRYHKTFFDHLNWSAGAAFSYTEGKTNLYGNHYGSTQALYTQFDYTFFGRLGASLGIRWERYTLDKTDEDSRPVIRVGVNYEATKFTFIRASFGQGYRYPSMAEKYTSTGLSGLKIFPNYDLYPETGWSAEIGLKQGFLHNDWSGYFDIAGYWTEYNDMIEFVFGLYNPIDQPPSLEYVGFKSVNTGKARINGIEVSMGGQGEIGPISMRYFAGYTYMNPLDLSEDSIAGELTDDQILKYRYRHAVKGDLCLIFRQFDLGLSANYRSFMERIDPAFEENILGQYFFPGLKEYRQENNTGAVIFNLRLGWQISVSSKISFHVNNLLNEEYMGRPGDLYPPRNLSLQYVLKIN